MSRETGSRRITSPRKLSNPAPGTCLFLMLGCCIREVKPRAFHHLQARKLYKPSQSMLKYGRLSCSEALRGEGEGLLSQALFSPQPPGPGTGTSPFHEVNPSERGSVAACSALGRPAFRRNLSLAPVRPQWCSRPPTR